MMNDEAEAKPVGWVKPALVLVPVLLVVSIVGAVWMHWRAETMVDPHPGLALPVGAVDDDELRDLLAKLTRYLGPRDWKTPEGRADMGRAIALVDGTMSPRNFGYVVHRDGAVSLGGERWPVLWIDAKGAGDGVVLVTAPYDLENESTVALMALAAELRGAGLEQTLRFVFFPSALWKQAGSPDLSFLRNGDISRVICVNRWQAGPGRDLWLVGPDWGPGPSPVLEIVDHHVQDSALQRDGTFFDPLGTPVHEIRGTGTVPSAEDPNEVAAMNGRDLTPAEFHDFRARLRRLGEILRLAASQER